MISSLSFQQFKSYRDAMLPLAPLTLLIGANASGKSNAIEGIRFLSWLATGRRLDDLMKAVQAEDQGVRGTVQNLVYRVTPDGHGVKDTFGFEAEGESGKKFQIQLQVTAEDLRVISETIEEFAERIPLYEIVYPASQFDHAVLVRYNNFARGGKKPQILCGNQQAIFTQLDTLVRFSTKIAQRPIPRTVRARRRALEQILFLDPNPRAMRQYSFIVEKGLKDDGSNLSSVLYDLCEAKDRQEEVLDFVRSLPEQDIRDIGFIRDAAPGSHAHPDRILCRSGENPGCRDPIRQHPARTRRGRRAPIRPRKIPGHHRGDRQRRTPESGQSPVGKHPKRRPRTRNQRAHDHP